MYNMYTYICMNNIYKYILYVYSNQNIISMNICPEAQSFEILKCMLNNCTNSRIYIAIEN